MKKIFFVFIITLLILFSTTQTTLSNESIKTDWTNNNLSEIQVNKNLASMPLSFTENQGQWDDKVKFRANAGGATMWFASDGAYYQFTRTIESEESTGGQTPSSAHDDMTEQHQQDFIETMMIKANFVGANQSPQMIGVDMTEYKCNYFIGNDESKWATDVPNYQAVMYEEIYNGIDLKYYGNGTHIEYDFIVSPGVDFSQIKIQYEGAESISINDNGELVVTTMWGEVVEQRPMIYQVVDGSRTHIDGAYALQDLTALI